MARYKSINEVPRRWRTLGGTPLTLPQIEVMIMRAENSKEHFAAAFGRVKAEFLHTHKVVAGFWVQQESK